MHHIHNQLTLTLASEVGEIEMYVIIGDYGTEYGCAALPQDVER